MKEEELDAIHEVQVDITEFIQDHCDLFPDVPKRIIVAIVQDTYQMVINEFCKLALKEKRDK